jgi:hypothetical protein
METEWFYMEGTQRQGPMDLETLVSALRRASAPHAVAVWREGMAQWRAAGDVPEISQRLPPPPVQSAGVVPFDDAEAIARLYRRLVLLVGAQILAGGFYQTLSESDMSQGMAMVALLFSVGLLGISVAMVVTSYRLARYLGLGVPVLWAVAMFIPCINLLVLLLLSSKAQTWCQRYGIKVGFLGPTKESIEEVRRRGETSAFD